ncbi:hypothetical protein C8R45DRAFT_935517 [Mycena sanguinolenta]|nr:hypothetical protein C8R45DRAFT_935517 [Mycena sanguinolenta]
MARVPIVQTTPLLPRFFPSYKSSLQSAHQFDSTNTDDGYYGVASKATFTGWIRPTWYARSVSQLCSDSRSALHTSPIISIFAPLRDPSPSSTILCKSKRKELNKKERKIPVTGHSSHHAISTPTSHVGASSRTIQDSTCSVWAPSLIQGGVHNTLKHEHGPDAILCNWLPLAHPTIFSWIKWISIVSQERCRTGMAIAQTSGPREGGKSDTKYFNDYAGLKRASRVGQ